MKPSDIYKLKPIKVGSTFRYTEKALANLCNTDGSEDAFFSQMKIDSKNEQKIEDDNLLRWHLYMDEGDDKYGGVLYALYYETTPYMIVKNHGRYYETYDTFLTNQTILEEKVRPYLKSLAFVEEQAMLQVYTENEEIPDLGKVSDYDINDYNNSNFTPLYQKGDVVWAWVAKSLYDNAMDSDELFMMKCRIKEINEVNQVRTYQVEQLWREFKYKNTKASECFYQDESLCQRPTLCDSNDMLILGKCSEYSEPECSIRKMLDKNNELPDNATFFKLTDAIKMMQPLRLKMKLENNLKIQPSTLKRKI